ncbi:hypothetical protein QVD99_006647 [Batrachochytrium dendrobatidis]|nr:hypothetical protein O5D80_005372 [Batrachochytrium dendrobatidis]KAK5666572.1 hypothetical protein QVD99_006647 [Batrachochytrium dendrobatidis]
MSNTKTSPAVFNDVSDPANPESQSSTGSNECSMIVIPSWVFNWWVNSDTLAWAKTTPLVTQIQVCCQEFLLSNISSHVQLREDSESSTLETLSIHLSRVSTFPWTPTSAGIHYAEETIDELDESGHLVLNSAKNWTTMSCEEMHGTVIALGTIIMIPRNKRIGVFFVEKITGNNREISLAVKIDNLFRFVFEKPITLNPTYYHRRMIHQNLVAYEQQAIALNELIWSSLHRRRHYEVLGIKPTRAVFVSGAHGTGKEFFVVNTVCKRAKLPLIYFHICDELQLLRTNTSKKGDLTPLRKAVWKAILSAPSVLYIDGLDLLSNDAKLNDVDQKEATRHIVQILSEMTSATVCIVATVVDPTKLSACLQPSSSNHALFSKNIELGITTAVEREQLIKSCFGLLEQVHGKIVDDETVSVLSKKVAQLTAGYVTRDLFLLITRATHACLKTRDYTFVKQELIEHPITDQAALQELSQQINTLNINQHETIKSDRYLNSLTAWLIQILPSNSASIGFDTTKRDVSWKKLGGYDHVKSRLFQLVVWPIQYPEAFLKLGVSPPSGLLLYGPSGCGKTMLVHAIATESNMNFITVKSQDLFSKYLGESEANIRSLFASARQLLPCIIFFDEIDAIATRREWTEDGTGGVNERVLSTLLNEMDGLQERKEVTIIACTNRPEKLDDALLRPGRLDRHIYVGLPTASDRLSILKSYPLNGTTLVLSDEEYECVAEATSNYTGADIESLIREAGMCAMRESTDCTTILMRHVKKALECTLKGKLYSGSDTKSSIRQIQEQSTVGWWRPGTITRKDLARFEKFEQRKS